MKPLLLMLVVVGWGMSFTGCAGKDTADQPPASRTGSGFRVEFRDASDAEQPGTLQMNLSGTRRFYHVSNEVLLDNRAIARAEIDTVGRSHPAVTLLLTEEGSAAFAELTRTRIGKRVGIVVDGLLVSAPLVMAEINEGRAVIDGKFDRSEAERIVRRINQE